MKPKRIQRRRTKGWRMPEGAIYVGRPTIVGNVMECQPHRCSEKRCGCCPRDPDDAFCCVVVYREYLTSGIENRPSRTGCLRYALDASSGYPLRTKIIAALPRLRGHDLACWCALDKPCHADVLLEIANA